jgi:hypothetical protein
MLLADAPKGIRSIFSTGGGVAAVPCTALHQYDWVVVAG